MPFLSIDTVTNHYDKIIYLIEVKELAKFQEKYVHKIVDNRIENPRIVVE